MTKQTRGNVKYLIKEKQLLLKHVPGKGAWTYHIEVPGTKDIIGRWGFLKVSGSIDNYELQAKNLFTITGKNKLLSVNETIRKAINKSGGDYVTVTLYLLPTKEPITSKKILETFRESGVLNSFKKLPPAERKEILKNITSQKSEEKQIELIARQVDFLSPRHDGASHKS